MKTTIEKVIYLQRIEMFADIPSEQLAHLASITQAVRGQKGDILFKEKDASHSMYILVHGRVVLEREGKIARELTDETAFGVWGFFDQEPRLVTAKVIEDSLLLKIMSNDFFDLLEERVHLSHGLLKYFAKRIRHLVKVSDTLV